MRAPGFLAALLAGLLALGLAACGVDTKDAGNPTVQTTGTGRTSTIDEAAAKRLPKSPNGVVRAEGPVTGSLTPQVSVDGVRVSYAPQGESNGFRDLCEGNIDVLDTSRQITNAERKLCNDNGVELADAIQVASDAVVIATPNEHDVGGDCLRMSTVNDIFKAGSPINNWNQVGFFGIPLHVTGGESSSAAFQFFAQLALGVPSGATLDDVRNDYILRTTDDGIRHEVTSFSRLQRVRRRFAGRLRDARDGRDIQFQLEVDRAITEARKRMLDRFAAEDARIAANQTVLTTAQKDAIRRRHLRQIEAALRAAQERAVARFSYPRLTRLRARYGAALRHERRLGTIGIFRFSYYEAYEQQLRPMEIWDPARAAVALESMRGVNVEGTVPATSTTATTTNSSTSTTGTATTTTATTTTSTTPTVAQEADGDVTVNAAETPWCVFPSQQTITNGSYPLSRPLLLYVSKTNLARDEVQTFLRSYLARAQALARANRLVPIGQGVQDRNTGIIDLDKTPGVADVDDATETTITTTTTTTEALPGVGLGGTTTTTPTTSTSRTTTGTTTTTP
jgi:ABC-type phosphate transport system substrate-binding protein